MEYTQNYALRKPGLNEYANVGDLNFNADKIDSQMKKNQDVDGEVYDPTSTSSNAYEAGDYVINPDDGLMYVCNGTTYGTWDATKWDHTTEFEELQKAMASGGESELADLHDVEITNPTDGQALLYDPTSLKWHNSDLPDADVTKEASGNPIEFEDGAAAPMVKCMTEITGSQNLHGYDKPWVGGAGKNKINAPDVTLAGAGDVYNGSISLAAGTWTLSSSNTSVSVTVEGVTGTMPLTFTLAAAITTIQITASGAGEFKNIQIESGSTATTYSPYSNICPITAYTEGEIEVRGKNLIDNSLSAWETGAINSSGENSSSTDQKRTIGYYPLIGGQVYTISGISIPSTTSDIRFFQYDENGDFIDYKNFNIYQWTPNMRTRSIRMRVPVNLDISNLMIEKGSTATTYEPYTSTTHSTTFPSAIYRGSEDVVNGEVTSEWGKIVFDGSSDENWLKSSSNQGSFYINVSNIIRSSIGLCNCAEFVILSDYTGVGKCCMSATSFNVWLTTEDWTVEQFKTYIASHNIEIAYQLATPTTTSVTPTNLPIRTLSGYNHIESSTGEMEIEYFPQKEQPLIDLIGNTVEQYANVYSTDERAIGEWIDGNTLYRRTYEIEVQSPSAPYTQDISISGMVVVGIEKHYANYQYNGTWYYESGDQLFRNSSQYLSITQKDEAGTALAVSSNMGNGLDAIKICFSILYTKTSTRSLAKSAPTEETEEEPVEEVKEEETKEEGEDESQTKNKAD